MLRIHDLFESLPSSAVLCNPFNPLRRGPSLDGSIACVGQVVGINVLSTSPSYSSLRTITESVIDNDQSTPYFVHVRLVPNPFGKSIRVVAGKLDPAPFETLVFDLSRGQLREKLYCSYDGHTSFLLGLCAPTRNICVSGGRGDSKICIWEMGKRTTKSSSLRGVIRSPEAKPFTSRIECTREWGAVNEVYVGSGTGLERSPGAGHVGLIDLQRLTVVSSDSSHHEHWVDGISFDGDRGFVCSVSEDGTLGTFSRDLSHCSSFIQMPSNEPAHAVVCSSRLNRIFVGTRPGFITVFDPRKLTGSGSQILDRFRAHSTFVNDIVHLQAEEFVSVSDDGSVVLWDGQKAKKMRQADLEHQVYGCCVLREGEEENMSREERRLLEERLEFAMEYEGVKQVEVELCGRTEGRLKCWITALLL